MAPKPPHWADRFSQLLPGRETLAAHPRLRPFAERLMQPQLWRLQHEAVARGVAVGTFWAFVIPVGQTVVAAAHCVWWRANIPAAAAMTLVTNPLTIGFWLWLAYQVGATLVGGPALAPAGEAAGMAGGVADWLAEYGWPTVLGMGLFAVGGALLGYLAVKLVWRLRVVLKRRERLRTA